MESGGSTPRFLIEADYEMDGVTCTFRKTWSSPREVGSMVAVSCNSAKPSDNTTIEDPAAGKLRAGMLTVGSGIDLPVIPVPLVTGKERRPKDKHAKPED